MPRYVAFLRGINLGKRRPPMSQLRELFKQIGFDQVETFIASGNVLFSSKETNRSELESKIARQLETSLGYEVDTFVRTVQEVARIGKAKLFPEESEPGVTIHVGFLHDELAPDVARKLAAVRTKEDAFRVNGREYYWLCRGRMSDSKVWALPEIKALRLPRSSMRNIISIRKLIAKHLVFA
jgi:uncharacterized protein (DUF1697 family)